MAGLLQQLQGLMPVATPLPLIGVPAKAARAGRWRASPLVMLLMTALCGPVQAQTVVLAGRMGEKALLVIDGRPRTMAVGESTDGIRLLRWVNDSAEIELPGRTRRLLVAGTPAQLGAAAPASGLREVVLSAGPGGHFTSAGTINGKSVNFMVDTGATLVSLGRADAERLGVDMSTARNGVAQTANGAVTIQIVTLNSVRLGELELANVGAAVMPQAMPVILLGNSFLARTQMRRDNDVMRLQAR